ncbi:MAG: hypothetical protein ABIN68_01060 [Sphingomicrobium sp.]
MPKNGAQPGGERRILVPIAYAAAGRFWVYPILLILAVGTWRTSRRLRLQPIEEPAYCR